MTYDMEDTCLLLQGEVIAIASNWRRFWAPAVTRACVNPICQWCGVVSVTHIETVYISEDLNEHARHNQQLVCHMMRVSDLYKGPPRKLYKLILKDACLFQPLKLHMLRGINLFCNSPQLSLAVDSWFINLKDLFAMKHLRIPGEKVEMMSVAL